MSRTRAIGIDLGTTFSAVSWLQDSGKTAMIVNSEGDILTPSVALFEDKEILVGKEARKIGPLKPTRYAECVKRDMGSLVFSRPICGEYMPPEVIQAWVLKKLKADILRTVGPDFRAVITVPAFFDEPRRKATADAGSMAALPVLDVVNEPTAAALAFGEELGYLGTTGEVREPLKVLVYDLGGGTFDVTILDMRTGDLRTLATDGDVRLGGRDWDMRLADHAAETFIHEHREDPRTNPASLQRLLNEVEEAKRTLSARQNATVRVDHAGSSTTVKVTRELFEQLTADLLERTSYTTRQMLGAAGLAWQDINRVLLVGGATRMPMVGRMLEQLSGIKPDQKVHPDEAVARGAAIYAGYLLATQPDSLKPPTFAVTNVNSHSLGIEGLDAATLRKRNVIVIPRNTPLPARVKERFVTKVENQRSVVVQVLEGESAMPSECTTIGRTSLRDLPAGLPSGWPVEITYEYETNGRLKVTAVVPGTKREIKLELEREGSLSDERLAKWKQVVSTDGGMDLFADIIAEELNLRKDATTFAPSANADHLTTSPATAATAPIPVEPSAATTRGSTHGTPGPTTPPGSAAPASAAPRPVPVHAAASGTPATAAAPASPAVWSRPVAPRQTPAQPIAQPAQPIAQPAQPMAQPVPQFVSQPVFPGAPTVPGPVSAPGGPVVASASTSPSAAATLPRSRGSGNMVVVIGFGLSAVVGLVLGYYILCYIKPQGNFLGLPPEMFPWKVEAPVAPPQRGTSDSEPAAGPARAR
ncbi:MAG TPA: Hsp70 family protein [Pirellulales bacterium]|jgi:molecular chaperone DnaK|nr:Hsp70 family protein [Pirellulales bacterium]